MFEDLQYREDSHALQNNESAAAVTLRESLRESF